MDKDRLSELKVEISNMDADIAENIKRNKDKIFFFLGECNKAVANDRDLEGIEKLLYDAYHYFDKGYRCDLTPEELREAILEEVDRVIKVK